MLKYAQETKFTNIYFGNILIWSLKNVTAKGCQYLVVI